VTGMGRVLAAGTAVVLFVLAAVVTLSFGSGQLAAALSYGGLACLAAAVLLHVNDRPR
jgi:hypothetical protein